MRTTWPISSASPCSTSAACDVGVVRDVLPGPANDALELDTGLLLPLVEDCVREVDLAGRRVHLNPGFTD